MMLLVWLCLFFRKKEYSVPNIIGFSILSLVLMWCSNYVWGLISIGLKFGSDKISLLYWVLFIALFFPGIMIASIHLSYHNSKYTN